MCTVYSSNKVYGTHIIRSYLCVYLINKNIKHKTLYFIFVFIFFFFKKKIRNSCLYFILHHIVHDDISPLSTNFDPTPSPTSSPKIIWLQKFTIAFICHVFTFTHIVVNTYIVHRRLWCIRTNSQCWAN